MAATKLSTFQYALRHLADARLALVSDDVESRYALDDAWPRAVPYVLGLCGWRFALKTAALATGGTAQPGYSNSFALPSDCLLVHALFRLGGTGREVPFDLREQGGHVSANFTAATIRYVSDSYIDPAFAAWPEHFAEAVGAYLAFLVAERVTGDRASAGRMSQLFSSLLPAAQKTDAVADDIWLPFQRSGAFLRVARTMTDEAFWRFVLRTVLIMTPSGAGDGGYAYAYDMPDDWSRTRQLYRLSPDGRRMPFDIREAGTSWHTDAPEFYAQYVSSALALDATLWSDHYLRAVLRQIQFDEDLGEETPEGTKEAQVTAPAWKDAVAAAADGEADAPDPWLDHQLTGEFRRAKDDVLDTGFWLWALAEVQYVAETDQLAEPIDFVLPFRFQRPDDWFRTHALFVPWDGQDCPINAREVGNSWTTDAPSFVARYLTTAVLDETTWPEMVAVAVLARLQWVTAPPEKAAPLVQVYEKLLADALAVHARPPDEWFRFEIDGSFRQSCKMLIEEGRWRFAVRTVTLIDTTDALPAELGDGTPSDGYRYRFIQPPDNLRTLSLHYRQIDNSYSAYSHRNAIDFRDEGDSYSANCTPVVVRYVSRLGLDSTRWSPHFRNAVLAWLQYNEARADPRLTAIAEAKYKAFEQASLEAEKLDDTRDVPQVRSASRFVSGRYGRGSLSLEQAWPPWA